VLDIAAVAWEHIHDASVPMHVVHTLILLLCLLPHLPGFEGFRGVQEEAVRAALQGEVTAAAATSHGSSSNSNVSYMSMWFENAVVRIKQRQMACHTLNANTS
jgi:hypothetical protein